MANDLFDRLAAREVPPVPAELEQGVHDRLNKMLLVSHLTQLASGAMVEAFGHLGRGLVGLLMFTLTGDLDFERRPRRKRR